LPHPIRSCFNNAFYFPKWALSTRNFLINQEREGKSEVVFARECRSAGIFTAKKNSDKISGKTEKIMLPIEHITK